MRPALNPQEFLMKMYNDSRVQIEEFQDKLEDTIPHFEIGISEDDFAFMKDVLNAHCKNVLDLYSGTIIGK